MKTYRTRPGSWPGIRSGIIITALVLCVVVAGLVQFDVISVVEGIEILLPSIVGVIFYGLRRQKRWWQSFEISLDDDTIVQRAAYGQEIRLRRDEVTDIIVGPGGWLIVKGGDQENAHRIIIPNRLEGFGELKSALEKWTRRP